MFAETQAHDHDDMPFHAMTEAAGHDGSASPIGDRVHGAGGAPAAAGHLFNGMYDDMTPHPAPPQRTDRPVQAPPLTWEPRHTTGTEGGRPPDAQSADPGCRVNPNTGVCPPPARVRVRPRHRRSRRH